MNLQLLRKRRWIDWDSERWTVYLWVRPVISVQIRTPATNQCAQWPDAVINSHQDEWVFISRGKDSTWQNAACLLLWQLNLRSQPSPTCTCTDSFHIRQWLPRHRYTLPHNTPEIWKRVFSCGSHCMKSIFFTSLQPVYMGTVRHRFVSLQQNFVRKVLIVSEFHWIHSTVNFFFVQRD